MACIGCSGKGEKEKDFDFLVRINVLIKHYYAIILTGDEIFQITLDNDAHESALPGKFYC